MSVRKAKGTDVPRHAMVLAAGLGLRMRPLTDNLPKPLVQVNGRAMLDRVLDRIAEAGVRDVVVNHYYLGEMIERHLESRNDLAIRLSPETELLDTGGGVTKALPWLGKDPFFVCNGDILWLDGRSPALRRLAAAWDDDRMDALLLLHPGAFGLRYQGVGDFFMDPVGRLRRRREREVAPFIFAGVQILHPRLFEGAPEGAFSLNRLYDKAAEAGRLWGLRHDGEWFHIGTPEDLDAVQAVLQHMDVISVHR